MVMFDRAPYMKAKYSLLPAVLKTATNGVGVALKGYDSAVAYIITGAYTDGAHVFELKDSPDDVTYTAVDDKYLSGVEPTIDAAGEGGGKCYRVGYKGPQPYLRVDLKTSSGTTGALMGAIVVLGDAYSKPVTQD